MNLQVSYIVLARTRCNKNYFVSVDNYPRLSCFFETDYFQNKLLEC